jgi:hypothetical protein
MRQSCRLILSALAKIAVALAAIGAARRPTPIPILLKDEGAS